MRRYEHKDIKKTLPNLNPGLYFVGLDCHVGYLFKNSYKSYFIHSNYIEDKVMIEDTEHSEAFLSNEYFISKISGNAILMKKWLKKEEIKIFRE